MLISRRQSAPCQRSLPSTSQGWESVPEQGLEWFSYRFRRPVRG